MNTRKLIIFQIHLKLHEKINWQKIFLKCKRYMGSDPLILFLILMSYQKNTRTFTIILCNFNKNLHTKTHGFLNLLKEDKAKVFL